MGTLRIETNKPIAYDSPDHIQPHGTAENNTVRPRFNEKLFRYIPPGEVRLLDLGCSGGGLVKSILDDGGFGVGVEGSDYSLRHRRAEWATIPDHLFTADATVDFQLNERLDDGRDQPLQFNVITAWEFFEHIAQAGIPGICANILRHLAPGGIVMASIATYPDVVNGVVLHQTIHLRPWWEETFLRYGLERQKLVERYFNFDMVNGQPIGSSFTIVLTRKGEALREPETLRRLTRMNAAYEAWRYAGWLSRFDTWHHLAWLTKRKIEARVPGGREFS